MKPLSSRRTRIVATLGPATDEPGVLEGMLAAGLDVVRLNFSHGKADDHRQRVQRVREVAAAQGCEVAVLADLQGPKIRIAGFASGPTQLKNGQPFTLDTKLGAQDGDNKAVGLEWPQLLNDVGPGDTLLLSDGAIRLTVDSVDDSKVHCTVVQGGKLADRQGLNRLGGGISADALTEKDFADIVTATELNADYMAVSFPASADDMLAARRALDAAGSEAYLVAKIERQEALVELEGIIRASDAVMVARGDLGVEIGDAELPGVQKRIIRLSRELNRPVITATQMMESMRSAPQPTRAEVMDVANAVLDGSDAVMLSAETATGDYPVKTVETMSRICEGAQRHRNDNRSEAMLNMHFQQTDEAIAVATVYTANHMNASAILALTESGNTALLMSRMACNTPIYALTPHKRSERRLKLCYGVISISFNPGERRGAEMIDHAVATLVKTGVVSSGQRVLVAKGDFEAAGATNTMKIVTVD